MGKWRSLHTGDKPYIQFYRQIKLSFDFTNVFYAIENIHPLQKHFLYIGQSRLHVGLLDVGLLGTPPFGTENFPNPTNASGKRVREMYTPSYPNFV